MRNNKGIGSVAISLYPAWMIFTYLFSYLKFFICRRTDKSR